MHWPLGSSHNIVNVVAAGTSDTGVRVLLLKYRELVAQRLHFLRDQLLLQFRSLGREHVISRRLYRLFLHVRDATRVHLLER